MFTNFFKSIIAINSATGSCLCGADGFKSPKCNLNFQHFVVIIQNLTSTFNILQSLFKM